MPTNTTITEEGLKDHLSAILLSSIEDMFNSCSDAASGRVLSEDDSVEIEEQVEVDNTDVTGGQSQSDFKGFSSISHDKTNFSFEGYGGHRNSINNTFRADGGSRFDIGEDFNFVKINTANGEKLFRDYIYDTICKKLKQRFYSRFLGSDDATQPITVGAYSVYSKDFFSEDYTLIGKKSDGTAIQKTFNYSYSYYKHQSGNSFVEVENKDVPGAKITIHLKKGSANTGFTMEEAS